MDKLPQRKNIRLTGYDYSLDGYYSVTFCTKNKQNLFGEIVGTTAPGRPLVDLTPLGKCVDETIQKANNNYVIIDKHVVMPNHLHMIVILGCGVDDRNRNSDDRGRSSLQRVVINIKSYVTKWAGYPIWQPRFHDRIIRNEMEYFKIWRYIDENPLKWPDDCYYS